MKNKEEILSKIDLLIQALKTNESLIDDMMEKLKQIGDFINKNL